MTSRSTPLASALALALAASNADAGPRAVSYAPPGIAVTVPPGFEARPSNDPAPELLGTWERAGRTPADGPVVLQFVRLRAVVPQRPLTEREVAGLRSSDPFPFVDARTRARALGFDLDAIAGRATVRGHALVRFATAVPLVDDGALVVVMAPAEREGEARAVFGEVLASARGRTAWRTPRQRARASLVRGLGGLALALTLGYALLALTLFRRRDAWRPQRAAALALDGALWLVVALLLVSPTREAQWGAAARALVLGAVFTRHAWKIRRP